MQMNTMSGFTSSYIFVKSVYALPLFAISTNFSARSRIRSQKPASSMSSYLDEMAEMIAAYAAASDDS